MQDVVDSTISEFIAQKLNINFVAISGCSIHEEGIDNPRHW